MCWAGRVFLFMVGFIIYKGRSLTAICGRPGSQNHTACDPKQNCFLLQIWKWLPGPAVAAAGEADTVVSDGGGVQILNCSEPRKIILTDILERWRYWFWCFIMNILSIKSSKCWSYLHIAGCGKTMRWKKDENPYNRQLVFCLRETKRRISWHLDQGPKLRGKRSCYHLTLLKLLMGRKAANCPELRRRVGRGEVRWWCYSTLR